MRNYRIHNKKLKNELEKVYDEIDKIQHMPRNGSLEMRIDNNWIQWRHMQGDWHNLLSIDYLKEAVINALLILDGGEF
ncbi:MAG: hypothetical protein WC346_06395 [Methanogenium sp.]|jgi:hypothetical protein